MRYARPVLAVALVAAALFLSPDRAHAQERLVLDRVLAEPSYFDGRARLRLFVSPLTLEGRLLEVAPGELSVRAGGSDLRAPYFLSRFSGADVDLAIALVVHTGFDYDQDLPVIQRALTELLRGLPRSARVSVIAYGGQLDGGHRFEAPSDAIRRIDGLMADLAPEDPVLIQAGERALRTLRRIDFGEGRAEPRRLIVLVSDGHDLDPRPERYRQLGQRAAREGVRIHSLAYSPVDNRRPLLGLGELSKRSGGTFRWVRDPRGMSTHAEHLATEILNQPVLTLFPPADAVSGRRLAVGKGELRSDTLRLRGLSCGGEGCEGDAYCAAGRCVERARDEGAGVLGWLFRILLAGVTLFAVLLAVGFVLTRREEARRQRAAAAMAAAAAGGTSSRIAAQAPGGHVAPQPQPIAPQSPGGHPAAPGGHVAAPGAAPARALAPPATLFVVAGPGQGQRLPLLHGFTIGTGKRCDLVLPKSPQVADRHAQLVADAAGHYSLVDLGSPGGTFVNGVRATQMRLPHGASIKIGSAELRFLAA
jgi:hypothetical protein